MESARQVSRVLHAAGGVGLPFVLDESVETGNVILARLFGERRQEGAFDEDARVKDFARFARPACRDRRSLIRTEFDEAALRQPQEPVADRQPAGAGAQGELPLDETGAG